MTLGLTINQGAADNEIMAFKSSDVDHNFTALAETDTYLAISKFSGADGGGHLSGYSDASVGLRLSGRTMTEDTTFDSTMGGCVLITCQKNSGSGAIALSASAGALVVRNHSTNIFQVGGDGRTYQASSLFINEFTNTKMTTGLTINQGAATDEILTLKHSAVSHGATDLTEADTFAMWKNAGGGSAGGVQRMSFSDSTYPVVEDVFQAAVSTGLTTAAIGSFQIRAQKIGGGGRADLEANTNIFCIRARRSSTFYTTLLATQEGHLWIDGDFVMGTTTLTEANLLDLTDGGATTLHSHAGAFAEVSFSAYAESMTNIARDGDRTVLYSNQVYDNGGDNYNPATYIFTAPATGKYLLNAMIFGLNADSSAVYYRFSIKTSNRTYYVTEHAVRWDADVPYYNMQITVIADMDEADTAYVTIRQQGGADQFDISPSGNESIFQGCRIA
jgi:hypothetical protein